MTGHILVISPSLGGFVRKMPWVAFAFVVGGLTSMGMPGLSGFIAEFPIFMGLFACVGECCFTNW